jgi:hypothetical protein
MQLTVTGQPGGEGSRTNSAVSARQIDALSTPALESRTPKYFLG